MMKAQNANKYMCLTRWLLLTLVVLLSVLIVASIGQTATVDHHCIAVGDCLKSGHFLDQLIEENAQFKAALQDQAQQLRDLRTDLNYALNELRELTGQTTLTTPTTSISTKPHQISHLDYFKITVIPDDLPDNGQHGYVLYGGKLYFINSTDGLIGLKVHNALTGSFIEIVATPTNGDEIVQLAVCHNKSQMYFSTYSSIWYANISQLEPNSNAPWQKLTWYDALFATRPRSPSYFALSDDCEEIFLIFELFKMEPELEIRRFSDGELLVSRNNFTDLIHVIVGTKERYYIFQTDRNNGSSYLVEYDRQLEEVQRFGKALLGSGSNDFYYLHYLALHEDGGIFIAFWDTKFVWPDFTSFVELEQIGYAYRICYDPQLKLLGAMGTDGRVKVYNITLG